MMPEEIAARFAMPPVLLNGRAERVAAVAEGCRLLAQGLDDLLGDGREKSLAFTQLESVMFWATAAIARERDDQ